jgi:hypothetical protein
MLLPVYNEARQCANTYRASNHNINASNAMTYAHSNTNSYTDSHPTADIHYSDMASSLVDINFSELENTACLVLMHCCDESRAGLCHCLQFLSDMLRMEQTENFTPENLHQIGHTLHSISQLVPALTDLSGYLKTDLLKRGETCNSWG